MCYVPRLPPLLFLCLLSFVTPAAAEQAWVLWTGSPPAGVNDTARWLAQTEWWRLDSFENRAACIRRLDESKPGPKGVRYSETLRFQIIGPTHSGPIFAYQCLPDTVDPRARKGK